MANPVPHPPRQGACQPLYATRSAHYGERLRVPFTDQLTKRTACLGQTACLSQEKDSSLMPYSHVCLESFGYTLPEEVVTSSQLEQRLAPLYRRLRLPEGRLELITGIAERRFWREGTLPSEKSIESGRRALAAADFDRRHIGALVHASVCRDHLEPATACAVHHQLELPDDCLIYDVSNACLGILNGIVQVANMIELGQIRAGLVVGSEGSRQLVETTIETLNTDTGLTRRQIKTAVASLTIGSASCAVLLTHRDLTRTNNRLLHATFLADTRHHRLCHSGRDESVGGGMRPLMQTDSERLMAEGIATGQRTFERFLGDSGWSRDAIDRTFCHQVGSAHRKQLLDTLRLDPERDFTTLQWLGNTGSAALPVTMALGLQQRQVTPGEQVALLGIGSGINCLLLGARLQRMPVGGHIPTASDEGSTVPGAEPKAPGGFKAPEAPKAPGERTDAPRAAPAPPHRASTPRTATAGPWEERP